MYRMNQSPPRQRTIRTEPPALVRSRHNTRRPPLPATHIQLRHIMHPPILRATAFNVNNSNKNTVAYINANRLANFNSSSNNNTRMPVTKRRRLNGNANKIKKNGNKNARKTQRINVHKLPK